VPRIAPVSKAKSAVNPAAVATSAEFRHDGLLRRGWTRTVLTVNVTNRTRQTPVPEMYAPEQPLDPRKDRVRRVAQSRLKTPDSVLDNELAWAAGATFVFDKKGVKFDLCKGSTNANPERSQTILGLKLENPTRTLSVDEISRKCSCDRLPGCLAMGRDTGDVQVPRRPGQVFSLCAMTHWKKDHNRCSEMPHRQPTRVYATYLGG
jgi:hypothetical protein